MKTNMAIRRLALSLVLALSWAVTTNAEEKLTIGSNAPALDIEHWVQDGQGKFKPVTKFKDGNVYIVEFWATWCGPCIAAMPHVSQLQDKYASQGVQVISISDEDLETVEKFLEKEVGGDAKQTYKQLTRNYCLTTDPDGSSSEDYMRAAQQNGIPTAFIVGKKGHIEWIGHPMELDEPLAKVVDNSWDRDKFRKALEAREALQKKMRSAMGHLQGGDLEKGLESLEELLLEVTDENMKTQLTMIRLSVLLGKKDKRAISAFSDVATSNSDKPLLLNQLAWSIVQAHQQGQAPSKALVAVARKTAAMAVKAAPKNAAILDTLAHLAQMQGDLDVAIEIQTKAVKFATPEMKSNLVDYLEELEEEKAGSDDNR